MASALIGLFWEPCYAANDDEAPAGDDAGANMLVMRQLQPLERVVLYKSICARAGAHNQKNASREPLTAGPYDADQSRRGIGAARAMRKKPSLSQPQRRLFRA